MNQLQELKFCFVASSISQPTRRETGAIHHSVPPHVSHFIGRDGRSDERERRHVLLVHSVLVAGCFVKEANLAGGQL